MLNYALVDERFQFDVPTLNYVSFILERLDGTLSIS